MIATVVINMVESLSLVVPVYNEENSLKHFVPKIKSYFSKFEGDYEVIFVDDGSSDGSTDVISRLKNGKMRVEEHRTNKGYGEALKTGFGESSLDWIGYVDGDGQFNLEDLDRLLKHSDEYDIVAGKRDKRSDKNSRIIVGEAFNRIVRIYLNLNYDDVDCGLKIFRRGVIEQVSLNTRRTLDAELIAKAQAKGYNIKQVTVKHLRRTEGESEASGILGVKLSLIITTIRELRQIRRDIIQ